MPHRSPIATALIACAVLALPGGGAAASLGPLDGMIGPGAVLPGLDTPLAAAPDALVRTLPDRDIVSGPVPGMPRPLKFENDTGLDPNPLRSVTPENQWANPQAPQNSRGGRR